MPLFVLQSSACDVQRIYMRAQGTAKRQYGCLFGRRGVIKNVAYTGRRSVGLGKFYERRRSVAEPPVCARDGSDRRRGGAGARPEKRRLTAGSRRFLQGRGATGSGRKAGSLPREDRRTTGRPKSKEGAPEWRGNAYG